eukprot:s248_g21.t1
MVLGELVVVYGPNTGPNEPKQDFVEIIKTNFKPIRNRVLKAELLQGSLDMKKYLGQYRVEIAGLEKYEKLANDCILLVKHLVNSESLSQAPFCLLPAEFQKYMKDGLAAQPRNLVADRARKEWEKFAPGAIRTVTVAQGGDPDVPKKRGRPPKKNDGEEVKPKGDGEQVFGPRAKKRSAVVPPPVESVDDLGSPTPRNLEGDFANGVEPNATPWPTRATFAGRRKPDNPDAAAVYETRRAKFYEKTPPNLWKDGLERVYWNKCVSCESLDVAITEFLEGQGIVTQPSSSSQAAPSSKGRGRGRAAAKSKAKAKSKFMKEPGRNRGRGNKFNFAWHFAFIVSLAMVDLPDDDSGDWVAQISPMPTPKPRNPKSAKRRKTSCKTSAASPSQKALSNADLPDDDDGLDLPAACDVVEPPQDNQVLRTVDSKVQFCDDSSLLAATASIPSTVQCPHQDLMDLVNLPTASCTPEMRCHFWEIFSAPRIGPAVRAFNGRARRSYDLKHYWDLGETSFQRAVLQDVLLLRPLFVMLSPPCTWVCQLQHSNWKRIKKQDPVLSLIEALDLLDFSTWLAYAQSLLGCFFALEHPDGSLAWGRESAPLF